MLVDEARGKVYASAIGAPQVAVFDAKSHEFLVNIKLASLDPRESFTHHAPSATVSGSRSAFSPAFASDLDGWIKAHWPDYWFFGHTHRPLSTRIRGAPVVNVSLGYPDEVPEDGEVELLLRGLIFPGA